MYNKFIVTEADQFNPDNYPGLLKDLGIIKENKDKTATDFRSDILISFTKNHALKLEWINANPQFTELVTCNALPIANLEALFEASAKNLIFNQQLEDYLRATINNVKTNDTPY